VSEFRGLVAITRQLDFEPDLVAAAGDSGLLFVHESIGIAGVDVAGKIRLPRTGGADDAQTVRVALESIECKGAPALAGVGVVALGALPFDPESSGELTIPAITIARCADGTNWLTTIGPAEDLPRDRRIESVLARATSVQRGFSGDAAAATVALAPSRFEVRPERPADEWCDAVAMVTERIAAGQARKVVLARAIEIIADQPFRAGAVLALLRRSFPASYLFSIDGFVGATPELLVTRDGDSVRSHPMAGTAPRSGDPVVDARLAAALLASSNTIDEHRQTIDMVHDALLPWCSYLDEEDEPSIVAMANVQHLSTRIEGRLSSPAASVLELVGALHPTPAVGGAPRAVALEMIRELEGLDRGRYAGPVGWVDAAGNGTWAVGIRSAELDGTSARLFAGVGVVADSDPDTELAETRAKLQALLGAIVRP
jgi:isochorismate synthase